MPVIAANISADVLAEINRFLAKGIYQSASQFIELAVANQLALENGGMPTGLVHLPPTGTQTTSAADAVVRAKRTTSAGRRSDGAEGLRTRRRPSMVLANARDHLRDIEKSAREYVRPPKEEVAAMLARLAVPRTTAPAACPTVARPAAERIWGQVNRLFPLKFACRWLACDAARLGYWPSLDSLGVPMAEDAALLGTALELVDLAKARKRDELLSTGLPRRNGIMSRDRFLSQIVARKTRASDIYEGAIFHYGLAEFSDNQIVLTERGNSLAYQTNPILDGSVEQATTTLSDNERSFFLHQIAEYVPGELRDLKAILMSVAERNVTPDDLGRSIRPLLPESWSTLMVRTHVSGAVARLAELGLLRREWEGRRVRYLPSSDAKEWSGGELARFPVRLD